MKTKKLFAKIALFIVSALIVIVVDIYFSNNIYRNHEPIVKGLLGVTLLVMAVRYVMPKQVKEESIQLLFTLKGVKFLLASLFWAIVSYWAIIEVIDMILYIVRLFKQ